MDEIVDAIEDGKIVRVSAEHAKREGLLVLRKAIDANVAVSSVRISKPADETISRRISRTPLDLDRFRKPLHKNNVISELKDNFHWELSNLRKGRGMTRKALAIAVNCLEEDIKLIENGVLPKDDFILIGALERFFNTSLRKDKAVEESARKVVERTINEGLGRDIELFDEEHDFSSKEEKS